jgi:hypothetical protein
MKVALCFWGICRSTDLTIQSIQTCIFQPLKDAGIDYDIFVHTYTLYRSYSNPRANEQNIQLKNSLWKLLNPTAVLVEDQDDVDKKLDLKKYRKHGSPWCEDINTFNTLDNHIRALWSLKQVTSLWTPNKNDYSTVIYLRPDVRFLKPIDIGWLTFTNQYSIRIPNFHLVDGCNDRFAIGSPYVMSKYGTRFDNAWGYSLAKPLHSETFLAYELYRQNISIDLIPFKFIRVRADGTPAKADIFTRQI